MGVMQSVMILRARLWIASPEKIADSQMFFAIFLEIVLFANKKFNYLILLHLIKPPAGVLMLRCEL